MGNGSTDFSLRGFLLPLESPRLTLALYLISCTVRRILSFFSSSLQTLPLSSMLVITVLEHSPFPSACLHTPAHSVPLPRVSPCAECNAVLGESNPTRHRDDLTFT